MGWLSGSPRRSVLSPSCVVSVTSRYVPPRGTATASARRLKRRACPTATRTAPRCMALWRRRCRCVYPCATAVASLSPLASPSAVGSSRGWSGASTRSHASTHIRVGAPRRARSALTDSPPPQRFRREAWAVIHPFLSMLRVSPSDGLLPALRPRVVEHRGPLVDYSPRPLWCPSAASRSFPRGAWRRVGCPAWSCERRRLPLVPPCASSCRAWPAAGRSPRTGRHE